MTDEETPIPEQVLANLQKATDTTATHEFIIAKQRTLIDQLEKERALIFKTTRAVMHEIDLELKLAQIHVNSSRKRADDLAKKIIEIQTIARALHKCDEETK